MTDRGSSGTERHSGHGSNIVEVGGVNPSPGTTLRTDPAERKRDPYLGKHIRWGEEIGIGDCPYLKRWVIEFPKHFSIRLHHFVASDDDRAFHDHPWWFVTLVLKGTYTDWSPRGHDTLGPGSIRYRPALHRHTVLTEGVWSLVITGPKFRAWGFWDETTGKFVKANKWFFTRGHHPCE